MALAYNAFNANMGQLFKLKTIQPYANEEENPEGGQTDGFRKERGQPDGFRKERKVLKNNQRVLLR